MKLMAKRTQRGDMLVIVKFEKTSNFDPQTLTWVPKYTELEGIIEALKEAEWVNENPERRCCLLLFWDEMNVELYIKTPGKATESPSTWVKPSNI